MANRAITEIDTALREFEEETGMVPRVILLPEDLYRVYESEYNTLDKILPKLDAPDGHTFAEVRVYENKEVGGIEVY